jgi:hypothetical protein
VAEPFPEALARRGHDLLGDMQTSGPIRASALSCIPFKQLRCGDGQCKSQRSIRAAKGFWTLVTDVFASYENPPRCTGHEFPPALSPFGNYAGLGPPFCDVAKCISNKLLVHAWVHSFAPVTCVAEFFDTELPFSL